ncbi:MAG: ECF-type sigma factor, partial [Verrucomicrobiota bacterium]
MSRPDADSSSFPPTRWTMIRQIQSGNEEEATKAFADLCERYWSPIYAFLRHSGKTQEDAEDLTQMFFEQLIRDETLKNAQQQKGKLRTFLLAALKRMLSKRSRYENAQKRGGRSEKFSLDEDGFERLYEAALTDEKDPEQIYLKTWA